MIKSFKFKIKRPSKVVVARFEQTLSLCRELYNAALQERRDAWNLNRISISYYDQQNQLSETKSLRDDLKSIYSQVLCDVLRRVEKSFDGVFRRIKAKQKAGFPRFKSLFQYNSFCYPQTGFVLDGDELTLSKIGKVKIRLSRRMLGKAKTLTVKREKSGWFVIFAVEVEKEHLAKTGKQTGVDVGIESFATLSDGTKIKNFKYYEKSQKVLRIAQRKVSRCKKFSNGWKKAINRVSKIHTRIKNRRNDFAHKLSTNLIKEYDLIAIEDLNISGMRKGILSKQIHDVAWNSFFQKLTYKAEYAGRQLIKVNPNGTSQTCLCGETVKKDLSVRVHHCLKCGYKNHRDIVSAQIILRLGQTAEMSPSERISLKDITYVVRQSVSLESPTTIKS